MNRSFYAINYKIKCGLYCSKISGEKYHYFKECTLDTYDHFKSFGLILNPLVYQCLNKLYLRQMNKNLFYCGIYFPSIFIILLFYLYMIFSCLLSLNSMTFDNFQICQRHRYILCLKFRPLQTCVAPWHTVIRSLYLLQVVVN